MWQGLSWILMERIPYQCKINKNKYVFYGEDIISMQKPFKSSLCDKVVMSHYGEDTVSMLDKYILENLSAV